VPAVAARVAMMHTLGASRSTPSQGHAVVSIPPTENVYSYFMYVIPLEEKKEPGRLTWGKMLAYTLVVSSLLLQGVLLFAIFDNVVNGDAEWRRTILNPKGEGFMGSSLNPYSESGTGGCNKGGSLCTKTNGTYSCAPPSVQLTGRWEELDTDGDGIWTRQEVEAARKDLQCKYVVNPVEVFDVFVKFLLAREKLIWIHPDLRAGRAIHKAYFTYASGDLIMCSYRNTDMCVNLLQRGVFDAPLKYRTAPRVGETIDSALAYCYALLDEGGVCERTLPSTYSVWKKASIKQCKSSDYEKFVYTHPLSGMSKSLLVVDYDARSDYSRATASSLFLVYKTIIIGIYLLAMLGEFKEIMMLAQWVVGYPAAGSAEQRSEESAATSSSKEAEEAIVISGTSTLHRTNMAILVTARLLMLFVLVWVGTMFLLKDTDYINLLLNSLGMIVVVEIIENVYVFLVSPELRSQVEAVEPMEVPALGSSYLNNRPALKDLLIFVVFVATVIGIMCVNDVVIVRPLSKALECACLSQGESCYEAQRFSYDFWRKYWKQDVPGVFADLDRMKARHALEEVKAEGGVSLASPPSIADAYEISKAPVAPDGFVSLIETVGGGARRTLLHGHRHHRHRHHPK